MSDSEIWPPTTEAQPSTNGNPVPIEVTLKVDAPEQVQIRSWPYPLFVELAWRDPDLTHGSQVTCFCEGFKYGSEDVMFKKDGQDMPGNTEHYGIQARRSCLVAFYPDNCFNAYGQFQIRMTMILKKNGRDLPPKVIESRPFTVTGNILDSAIRPSKHIFNLVVEKCADTRNIGQEEKEFILAEQNRIFLLRHWQNFQHRL